MHHARPAKQLLGAGFEGGPKQAGACKAPDQRVGAIALDLCDVCTVQAKVEVKTNADGVRGLFATDFVQAGGHLASIPTATIINAGGLTDSIAVGGRKRGCVCGGGHGL